MPACQENNMKYFNELRSALRIGSDIVPFLYPACLSFMLCSNPAELNDRENPRGHARATRATALPAAPQSSELLGHQS